MDSPDTRSALAMLASLQSANQLADAKIGILCGVQAALVIAVGPLSEQGARLWHRDGPTAWPTFALFVVFVLSFLASTLFSAQALRPRLWRPSGPNRFSFTLLAEGDGTPPPPGEGIERQEAWSLVHFLAVVTTVKHRYVTWGLASTGLMTGTAMLAVLLRPVIPH